MRPAVLIRHWHSECGVSVGTAASCAVPTRYERGSDAFTLKRLDVATAVLIGMSKVLLGKLLAVLVATAAAYFAYGLVRVAPCALGARSVRRPQ